MHGLVGELEYKVLVIDKKSQKKIKTRLKQIKLLELWYQYLNCELINTKGFGMFDIFIWIQADLAQKQFIFCLTMITVFYKYIYLIEYYLLIWKDFQDMYFYWYLSSWVEWLHVFKVDF